MAINCPDLINEHALNCEPVPLTVLYIYMTVSFFFWQIFVYTFCLINICLSLSDDANKIKTLNIERAQQCQLSVKICAQYTEWFRRNSLLNTRNFTENVWFANFFCRPAISQFLMADISFNIVCKELQIVQIAQLNQLFQLLHLLHMYGHSFYELSRMLMRKNVNNDVSNDLPI